jgi:hypothetical protein
MQPMRRWPYEVAADIDVENGCAQCVLKVSYRTRDPSAHRTKGLCGRFGHQTLVLLHEGGLASQRVCICVNARLAPQAKQQRRCGVMARARVSPPVSAVAKSKFFRPIPTGRIACSAALLSIATRPSSGNRKMGQRLSEKRKAFARLPFPPRGLRPVIRRALQQSPLRADQVEPDHAASAKQATISAVSMGSEQPCLPQREVWL